MNSGISPETFWHWSRHTVYFWSSTAGLLQGYCFSYIVEAVRCTWTSAHDVSFITGCHCSQGRRTSSQVALLNVPLPRFPRPDWNDWALRFSRNREKNPEMLALWSRIQGASYGKKKEKKKEKAHWCLVWLQLPTYIIFFLCRLHEVITGLHVQHRMHITRSRNSPTSCFRR